MSVRGAGRAPGHRAWAREALKAALILLGLAAIYLVGQLFMVWRSRHANLPKPPPGGWKKPAGWDDEDDDWPARDR